MTDTPQEEVAAWLKSLGFQEGPFTPNGKVYTHPNFQFGEYISETQATFFYQACQAERRAAVDGFVREFQTVAVPETTDYANGWNDCRKRVRQGLDRLASNREERTDA